MANATRRCAIYTRKSSEEGLEQDYNSLHAQREACEAFISSQAGEGWRLVKTAYDDGGFSGAGMERPGLQQLLANIREGLVDTVGPPHGRTWQNRTRIGFAGFLRLAPPETFSGSMRHRKSRAHAPLLRDSLINTKTDGLNGGAEGI
jgi:hypothetical protein